MFMEVEAMCNVIGDLASWETVECFFRKPNCSSGLRCSWLTKVVRRLAIIRAIVFLLC